MNWLVDNNVPRGVTTLLLDLGHRTYGFALESHRTGNEFVKHCRPLKKPSRKGRLGSSPAKGL